MLQSLSTHSAFIVGISLAFLYVLQKIVAFRKVIASIQYVQSFVINPPLYKHVNSLSGRNLPGDRTLLDPSGLLANVLPRIRGISCGASYLWTNKHNSA